MTVARQPMPLRLEADLDWYFGAGQTLNERSPFGAILDRQALYHVPRHIDPELFRAQLDRKPHEPPPGALTARPRGGSEPASGNSPEEGLIRRYAHISRLLKRLGQQDADAVLILAAYYGDQGARWGRTPHGRLFALLPLTPAGMQLLRRSRKRARAVDLGLSSAEQLGVEVEVQAVQPHAWRTLLIEQAKRQAWTAYAGACRLFAEVAHGGTDLDDR